MKTISGLLLACLACWQVQAASIEKEKREHQQPCVCSTFQELLALRQSGHAPNDFEVAWEESGGGGTTYLNIDLDGDGIDDKVERSCGASLDALCFLFVDLSSGKHLELEEERFFLARVESTIYVVVGGSLSVKEKDKRGKRRVYQITQQNIKLICSHL